MKINPKEMTTAEFHSYMLGAITPRPIAFASTVDANGNVNLSPFSFFNCFSANPPILIFSPARRVRDNTTKHTLENVLVRDEVVINIVNYDIVEQMSLASTEYAATVNEFNKAGLTPIKSEKVSPPRVGESPISFECKVIEVKPLGTEGGAGNLVICEVLLMHIDENILDENNKINPYKLDVVARMGEQWYCRANNNALFELPKPNSNQCIGIDQLPDKIRNSVILTGNNLARLGGVVTLPTEQEIKKITQNKKIIKALNSTNIEENLHLLAKKFLEKGKINKAWKVLLQR